MTDKTQDTNKQALEWVNHKIDMYEGAGETENLQCLKTIRSALQPKPVDVEGLKASCIRHLDNRLDVHASKERIIINETINNLYSQGHLNQGGQEQQENERLREALKKIAKGKCDTYGFDFTLGRYKEIAKQALKGNES